mmetsp:Transcript_27128/g.31348  ORF Transcript_27128/g.31348 Transcript_27128/m.31348 type:complete len:83 (+) Transcript_27128:1595-1843(+)
MVLKRWAITTWVKSPEMELMADWTSFSLLLSRALVASSKIRTKGSLRRARAMAILCFCPPESWLPPPPTFVSYPSGRVMMKS